MSELIIFLLALNFAALLWIGWKAQKIYEAVDTIRALLR